MDLALSMELQITLKKLSEDFADKYQHMYFSYEIEEKDNTLIVYSNHTSIVYTFVYDEIEKKWQVLIETRKDKELLQKERWSFVRNPSNIARLVVEDIEKKIFDHHKPIQKNKQNNSFQNYKNENEDNDGDTFVEV